MLDYYTRQKWRATQGIGIGDFHLSSSGNDCLCDIVSRFPGRIIKILTTT